MKKFLLVVGCLALLSAHLDLAGILASLLVPLGQFLFVALMFHA